VSLQIIALIGAFWTALAGCRTRSEASSLRCVVALASGAAATHLGWALLHPLWLRLHPTWLLDPGAGFCTLFLPLGIGLVTRDPGLWRSLPRALAVARLGCVMAGCCHGLHGERTPAIEIAGLAILHRELQRARKHWTVPAFLIGFGSIRLAVEPWRAPPPIPGSLDIAGWIALGWVGLGVGVAVQLVARSAPTPASPARGSRTQNVAPSPARECTSRVPP
jgi:hypothetical protein